MTVVSNSIALMIMKGIPSAPLDPNSAEAPMESLDLLDSTGLGLLTEGWSPAIAPLKNGGLWVDSATMDGRALLSDNVGNVVETMQVTCSSSLIANRLAILKKLGRLARMARAFHSTSWQIDPVYLKWAAACNNGLEQYALLYNIDWAINGDTLDPMSAWDVTLTMEREPYWRGLWPGANPIEWTFQAQGKTRGVQSPNEGYTYMDMDLLTGTNHLAYGTVQNRYEWNSSDYSKALAVNFIDIPATAVPGDAEALVCVTAQYSWRGDVTLQMALSTKPTTLKTPTGLTRNLWNVLNGGDADFVNTGGGSGKTIDTCGVFSNNSNVNQYNVTQVLAGLAAMTELVYWEVGVNNVPALDVNLWRGTYAVYLRGKQTAGTQGDVVGQLSIINHRYSEMILPRFTFPVLTPAASCILEWDSIYVGTVKLPFDADARSAVSGGRGLGVVESASIAGNLRVSLSLQNTNAAARTVEFIDLWFIPIDEAAVELRHPDEYYGSAGNEGWLIADNTTYLNHGRTGDSFRQLDNTAALASFWESEIESRGQMLKLKPGVNNRIYFMQRIVPETGVAAAYTRAADSITVRLNIVPRWSSVRDV